jgi:hypothetical protein
MSPPLWRNCDTTRTQPGHPDTSVDGVTEALASYQVVRDERIERDGHRYHRILIRTPWFDGPLDLARVLWTCRNERPHGGTIFVCETLAIVATGCSVDADTVRVSRFARFTSRYVRPVGVDLAQGIPERMQFVIDNIGSTRTLLACAAAAVTRPFGVRGAFYVIAGRAARDLGGMHHPYTRTLLPGLAPREAREYADALARAIGAPVAIVDVNDRGGRIRAVSPGGLPAADLLRALRDNPMGRCQSTPIGMVSRMRVTEQP